MSSLHSTSAVDAKSSIERSGFHLVKDPNEGPKDVDETSDAPRRAGKGKRFAQFYSAGYYTKTPQGLDFVFQNTMGDTVRLKVSLCRRCLTL